MSPERIAEIENRVAEIHGVAARSRPSGEGVAYELIAKGDGRTIATMSSRSDWIAMHSALVHAPADLTDLIAEVRALTAERDALRARVAELEGAARWRAAGEWASTDDMIEFQTASGRQLGFGPLPGEDYWEIDAAHVFTTADILGWRPLGPGPVSK